MIDLEKIKKYLSGDGEDEKSLNQFMRKKQNIIGSCVLALILIITIVMHSFASPAVKHKSIEVDKQTKVDGVLSTDFTQKNELSALQMQQSQMDDLKQQVAALNKKPKAAGKQQLIAEINAIMDAKKHASTSVAEDNSSIHEPIQTIEFDYPEKKHFSKFTKKSTPQGKTAKTFVPAGTFAKAVLLEGADANASVSGQSDTKPILVRIINSGTLPNGGHSHLRGCFVLASIYGDISSERGEARLTKLSCTRANGTILEKKVEGYLSFAGKEGIKGHPVMRNGKILLLAGASGMMSGFGSALQQSTQTQSTSPLGTTTSIDPKQVFASGAYGGSSTAMKQLADYYIKRADQYHPVIEIGSGTVATVIFQNGFSLMDEDKETPIVSNNNNELKDMLKQAQKISKQKEKGPFSNV